jgi:hypothetical protein
MKTHAGFFYLSALLLTCVLFFSGCKKDKNDPADTYNLIASQVIGSEGGRIISNDVIVEIPQYALNSSITIELYSSSTDNPYGENGNSAVFWLKGLPDPMTGTIRLSLRYKGSLSDQSFICFGNYVIATSGVDSTWSELLLPATDSSGFLQAILTTEIPNGLKNVSYTGHYGIPFWSISSYWYYSTNHFMIHFPGRYKSTGAIEALADGLEWAYDTLQNEGFVNTARTNWPLEVTVKKLAPEVNGQTDRGIPYTANSGYIEISTDIITDRSLLKITGAHEYFHIIQDLYNADEKYNWLQEASSVWFEEKFAANPALFVSDARTGLELEPYSGLQAGAAGNDTHHGYGCSAVLKYAASVYGNQVVKNTWEECKNGTHPVEAIKLSTGPYVTWFINFMRDYSLGNVYSDMTVSQFVYNEKFELNTDQDVQKHFEKDFPDLSAYAYVVEPKYSGFKDDSKLQLNLSGEGRSMYVLKKTGNIVTSIGYSTDQLVIPDLKDLQSSSSVLYVLITNYNDTPPDYTAGSHMTMDISVINSGHTYINYYASKNDTVSVCMNGGVPNFLIDVHCGLSSDASDFRITKDSTGVNDDYKWMELHYPNPQAGETKTLHVSISTEYLRKNPASGVTWDPYIYQAQLYISDKTGQNTLTMDGSGTYNFDIVYDRNSPWPFASLTLNLKDSQNQGYECNSTICWVNLFSE